MQGGKNIKGKIQQFIIRKRNLQGQKTNNNTNQKIQTQRQSSFLDQYQYNSQQKTLSTSSIYSRPSTNQIKNQYNRQGDNSYSKNSKFSSIGFNSSQDYSSPKTSNIIPSQKLSEFDSQNLNSYQNRSDRTASIKKTKSIVGSQIYSLDSSNFPYQDYQQDSNASYSYNNNLYNEESSNKSYSYVKNSPIVNMKKNNVGQSNCKSVSYKRKRLVKHKQMEQNQCAICLSKVTKACKLPCLHQFCLDCLTQWLQQSSICPYCRGSVPFYMHKGQKYEVEQKQFQVESEDDLLDYVCYNCDNTRPGDIILICDRCNVNACHIQCDQGLDGREPAIDQQWYCYECKGQMEI